MINKKHIQDVERLNNLLLSQEAKKRLKEAKENPYPESLYLLQLAKWGLENGIAAESREVSRQMLEDALLSLSELTPQKAYNFLVNGPDGPNLIPESLQGSPEDAAWTLLLEVEAKLQVNLYEDTG